MHASALRPMPIRRRKLGVKAMKILGSALIAVVLVVAMQSRPLVNPGPALSRPSDAAQASFMTADVFRPGECCNDDFRDALPLWQEPVDVVIAQP